MKNLLLIGASLIALTGCIEEELPTDTTLNFQQFIAWPEGNVTEANPDAINQDNIVFVVDRSTSMNDSACGGGGSRSEVARTALGEFIPQIPDNVAVGWVDFGRSTNVVVPIGLNNRTQLAEAASNHRPDMGGTYVGYATSVAFDMLSEQGLQQASTGTYRIVLIVDGGASDGNVLRSQLAKINQTPVEVMTAGFCVGSNHILNQPNDNVYVEATNVDDLIAVLSTAIKAESQDFNVSFATATPVAN